MRLSTTRSKTVVSVSSSEQAGGFLRQRHEHRVVGAGEGLALDQFLQGRVEALLHVAIRLPQVLLALVEPSGSALGHAHTVVALLTYQQ